MVFAMKRRIPKILAGCAVTFVVLFAGLEFILWYSYREMHRPEDKCRALIAGFKAGLESYKTEYGCIPADALEFKATHATQRTRGKILETLHPDPTKEPPKTNLRRIDFYDPPPAKNGVDGSKFDEQHHEWVLVDPWGEPLYFIIDLKGEGKVPNPDPRDNKEHPFINTSIIVFSAGPDRNLDTWEDNILSWK
jgi:hypothetical protein